MNKKIETITQQPLNAPIPVYGNMRMGDWYSWLREKSHNGEYCVDLSFAENLLRELSSFLSAIIIIRWAKQSDVEIETKLFEYIMKSLQEGEHFLTDSVIIPDYDWNEKDMVYDEEDHIGDVMSRNAFRAVSEIANQMNGLGNPYIWMFGEKGKHTPPMFKIGLFDDLSMRIYSHLGLIRTVIKETVVTVHQYNRKQAYNPVIDENDFEDWYGGENINLTADIYDPDSQIAVIPGAIDYSDANEFYMYLECLDLLDDNSDTVYIVGYPTNYTAEAADIVNRIGSPIAFITEENHELFPEAKNIGNFLFEHVGYQYDGDITNTAKKRGEKVCTKYAMERAQDIFYNAYPYQDGKKATDSEIHKVCEKLIGRDIEINKEDIPFGERGEEYLRSVFRNQYPPFQNAKFINDVVSIYIKNGVFKDPMNFYDWDEERQELTLQERYREFTQNVYRSGADCDIKALLNGVPVDDLLIQTSP